MTIDDEWLREKARQRTHQSAEARQREESIHADHSQRRRVFTAQIDGLWAHLDAELRRLAGVYNKEAGDEEIVVETHGDRLVIKSSDGTMTLKLNREQQSLDETFERAGGGSNTGGAIGGSFKIEEADQRLSFSEGSPADKARVVLEHLLA